ncbi:MAG: relaxase domain-containing protein [Opitutaceae bacterium]|jgi:conjugative relaxase-like TrwC/TraI family protein|nr:relaxase domain-containing protein [Opitutaceae bacterium]
MIRFDKPCVNVSGALEYFREHMKLGDYLSEGSRAEMLWVGQGSDRLGLSGVCRQDDFERLCSGRHPATGESLLARDKGNKRRVGFFGQISPPKDVSVACLVGGDSRIAVWWTEAVRETLQEIEAVTATRVRLGGLNDDRTTGNMVAAVVTHEANRALDPQLHTHVCIMNVTWDDQENRWKSVQPSAFYRHQGFFREVCYNRLAVRLRAAGYELERVRGIGFTIKGFPEALRETFSKRRKQILEAAAEAGISSQDGLQIVTVRTRPDKVSASADELREDWVREAGPAIEAVRAVIAQADGTPKTVLDDVRPLDALVSAEEHVFERRSVVDERLLLREALMVGRGQVSLEGLRSAIGERAASGELLQRGDDLASREGLESEEEFVAWAEAHREACPALGKLPEAHDLSEEQAVAVKTMLQSRSRVTVFQGDAGTGKTHSLKTVVAAIEEAGVGIGTKAFGCAPSAGATDVLRQELTPEAATLQQVLVNPLLQAQLRGQVIIVDEAGLMSVHQMRDLCRLAKTYDYRLLLVGDTKQHGSVEAGDALRAIQKFTKVPVARLTQIRRQKDPAFREAVADLAAGDAAGAVARFQKLRAVEEILNPITLFRKAAEDYVQSIRAGKSCLVVCPVWEEIWTFVHEARAKLRAEGMLAVEERVMPVTSSFGWTREASRQSENYHPNDVLAFHRESGGFAAGSYASVIHRRGKLLYAQREDGTGEWIDPRKIGGFDVQLARQLSVAVGERLLIEANDKSAKLKNGDLIEVTGFGNDGAILLRDGRQIPSYFRQYTYGYATTSHASQGKTVDRGILVMGNGSIALGNLKQAYVSNSRFRESQMIYTSDIEAAREAMGRYGDRLLVSEVMPSKPKPAQADVISTSTSAPPHAGMLSGMYGGVRASARVLLGRSPRFPSAIKSAPAAQSWAKAA